MMAEVTTDGARQRQAKAIRRRAPEHVQKNN